MVRREANERGEACNKGSYDGAGKAKTIIRYSLLPILYIFLSQ